MLDKAIVVVDIVCCAIRIVASDCNRFADIVELLAFKKAFTPLTNVKAVLPANAFPFEGDVIVTIPPLAIELEAVNCEAGWPATQLFM